MLNISNVVVGSKGPLMVLKNLPRTKQLAYGPGEGGAHTASHTFELTK